MKRADVLIRLMVGAVFLSEGIQKFLFPDTLGVGRFIKIGIPAAQFMAPFVGVVESIFGSLLILGVAPGLTSIPLLIVILVAMGTTKLPLFFEKGFWATAHEARADFSMFMALLYLILTYAKANLAQFRSGLKS